ncbi:MAG: beta-propeller domain-containing protein, partial [Planctomycetota bacterium]
MLGVDVSEEFDSLLSARQLRRWISQLAVQQYGGLFGTGGSQLGNGSEDDDDGGRSGIRYDLDCQLDRVLHDNSDSSSSLTRWRDARVDEADLVQTDGEFLYLTCGRELLIVRNGVGDALQIASRARLSLTPTGMSLAGERLILISESTSVGNQTVARANSLFEGATIFVDVIDVTDRNAPCFERRIELAGSLLEARLIDGRLRLVYGNQFSQSKARQILVKLDSVDPPHEPPAASTSATISPGPSTPHVNRRRTLGPLSIDFVDDGDAVEVDLVGDAHRGGTFAELRHAHRECRYESIDAYVDRVLESLPSVVQRAGDGAVVDNPSFDEPNGTLLRESTKIDRLTTVATLEVRAQVPCLTSRASLFDASTTDVYATADSVYLFSHAWRDGRAIPDDSDVRRFEFRGELEDARIAAQG